MNRGHVYPFTEIHKCIISDFGTERIRRTAMMATAMFAGMLDNTQHSTWRNPHSRSRILNSSREEGTYTWSMHGTHFSQWPQCSMIQNRTLYTPWQYSDYDRRESMLINKIPRLFLSIRPQTWRGFYYQGPPAFSTVKVASTDTRESFQSFGRKSFEIDPTDIHSSFTAKRRFCKGPRIEASTENYVLKKYIYCSPRSIASF